jgi:hypothetical protein
MASSSRYDPAIDLEEEIIFTSDDEADDLNVDDAVSAAAELLSDEEHSDSHEDFSALKVKGKRLHKEKPFSEETASEATRLPEFQPSLEM